MGLFALAFTSTGRYLSSVTLPVYLLHPMSTILTRMDTKYNCIKHKYQLSLSDCLLYLISVYLQSFSRNGSILITYVPKISFNGPLFKFQKGSNQKFSLFLHLDTCNQPIQQALIWRNLVLVIFNPSKLGLFVSNIVSIRDLRTDLSESVRDFLNLVGRGPVGYIDVGDGCLRRNVLVTILRCWWGFWPFRSPLSSISEN